MFEISGFEGRELFPITDLVGASLFPEYLRSVDVGNNVFYTDAVFESVENGFRGRVILVVTNLNIPLGPFSFGIGGQGPEIVLIEAIWTQDDWKLRINDINLSLLLSGDLLQPAEKDPEDPQGRQYRPMSGEVALTTTCELEVDSNFDIEFRGFEEFQATPVRIPLANSIYLDLEGIKPDFSRMSSIPEVLDAGFDEDFQGLYIRQLSVCFQDDLDFLPDIQAENLAIGTDGISGRMTATFDLMYHPDADPGDENDEVFTGDAAGKLFGSWIGLRKFDLEIRANEVVSSEITGQMLLPFFDQPVEIEMSLDFKGSISVGIKGVGGEILAELTKDDLISMKIKSFGFSKEEDEIAISLGGSIKPLIGGDTDWPEFGVDALTLAYDTDTNEWDVRIAGGWIDFQEALGFSIGGFRGELYKLGFGTIESDGSKRQFIGFSGSIGLISGFALTAAFEDLLLFYHPDLSVELKRARIGLIIPDTIALIGEISKRDHGFGGMLDLSIIPTEMRIMAGAEFGKVYDPQEYSYMQIIMALELPPPGIVLGSTPLAIRGFEGKHAMNMVPSMDPGWEWAITPPRGITPLSKMIPGYGGKMLGAGLKIATTDGTLLVINALFALLLPGPIIFIEGRGAVFSKLSDQKNPSDPPFYALIVIDGKEQYFSANLSLNADLAKGIIHVQGTVASFFDYQNPSNWYIKIGEKEPRSKRVWATVYKIIKATSYFEVYAGPHFMFGVDISINEKVNFSVGRAKLKILIAGDADLSWKPEHTLGTLSFILEIEIVVCGFGAGLSAFGYVEAKSPYPRRLYLAAGYRFFLNLPWPLPDVETEGEIEKLWKDGSRLPCKFEPLVKGVQIDSEIQGITAKRLEPISAGDGPIKIKAVPIVPIDARPTISFEYPMNDETPASLVLAGNASNGTILHKVDENQYKFSLKDIKLDQLVLSDDPAGFNSDLNMNLPLDDEDADKWDPVTIPYGVWMFDNSMTGHNAATTLRLFANTPFAHLRLSSFTGSLLSVIGIGLLAETAGWLNDNAFDTGAFNADIFMANTELAGSSTAADLPGVIADQVEEYPLGQPATVWNYLGFEKVPIQYGVFHISVTTAIQADAIHDENGTIRPFDVIKLHVLTPDENLPFMRTIPTVVKGVYFDGAIRLQFNVPVTDCELYLFPLTRRSVSPDEYPTDWPEDVEEHDQGYPDGLPEPCCKKAQELVNELSEIIVGEKAKILLALIGEVLDGCCDHEEMEEEGSPSMKGCCEKALATLRDVKKIVDDERALRLLHHLGNILDECCRDELFDDPQDKSVFLRECCEKIYEIFGQMKDVVRSKEGWEILKDLKCVIDKCCKADEIQGEDNFLTLQDCCENAQAILKTLHEVVEEKEAKALVKDLADVIRACCEREEPQEMEEWPGTFEECCEKLRELTHQLEDVVEGNRAKQLAGKLVEIIEWCCEGSDEIEQQLNEFGVAGDSPDQYGDIDTGTFLSFEFTTQPEVLYADPPMVRTWRQQGIGRQIVSHNEESDLVGSLYRLSIHAEEIPFDEVEIENTLDDQGLFLVAIGYLPDVEEPYESVAYGIQEFVPLAFGDDNDDPVVLSPRSCYRLTIETEADCDDQAPRKHEYYFRTDGPPAIEQIRHYLAWTEPGVRKYPHFRNYDLALRFRTNYVDELFRDIPLEIRLKSSIGQKTVANSEHGLKWINESSHLLSPEEEIYIDCLNASPSIATIDKDAIPGDKALLLPTEVGGVGKLDPDLEYTAILSLSPVSNYQLVKAFIGGAETYFDQYLPMMITPDPDEGIPAAMTVDSDSGSSTSGGHILLGASEDFSTISFRPFDNQDEETELYQFKFRSSRFSDFVEVFAHLAPQGEEIVQAIGTIEAVDDVRVKLESLSGICDATWRPAKEALWEKQLLVLMRLADEEDLLNLRDNMAGARQSLDEAFEAAVNKLPELEWSLLQPLPKKASVAFSPHCIFIQVPEPIEFARILFSYEEFDILAVCSSDETRWLVYPASPDDTFSAGSEISVSYRFRIGEHYPRLRYGNSVGENVHIRLGE